MRGLLFPMLALGCFAFSPTVRAVDPAPDEGYLNQKTADPPDSNTTDSNNALANWTWRNTGRLHIERSSHTATLLQNGVVLVAGGEFDDPLRSAELYDPATRTWTATGSLNIARTNHTATLLQNGMVLVAGGSGTTGAAASAELYDPASGTWRPTGSLNSLRQYHTAALVQNRMVLVTGGSDFIHNPLAGVELYNPASDTWTVTGSLVTARANHTATLLQDGTVLIAGGGTASAELGQDHP